VKKKIYSKEKKNLKNPKMWFGTVSEVYISKKKKKNAKTQCETGSGYYREFKISKKFENPV
jgi:hypothetical protein